MLYESLGLNELKQSLKDNSLAQNISDSKVKSEAVEYYFDLIVIGKMNSLTKIPT